VRAAYSIFNSVINGIKKDKPTTNSKTLFNEIYQQDQVTFSLHHLAYYTVWAAKNHLKNNQPKCPNLKKHLEKLIVYFGLMELQKDSAALFDCGYFKAGHYN
jgi:hypothetical protein